MRVLLEGEPYQVLRYLFEVDLIVVFWNIPLFVKVAVVPAPAVRKLIVLGLRSPRPLEADFFLEISKTSLNRKRQSS